MITTILPQIVIASLAVATVATSIVVLAKTRINAPINIEDANMIWKLHKRKTKCKGRNMQPVTKNGEVVGFTCRCGYSYMPKRPLLSKAPPRSFQLQSHALSAQDYMQPRSA